MKECTCTPATVTRYQKRISGPLLDRIDIHIEVPRVDYAKLTDERLGEPSSAVQARVEAARERQRVRFLSAATEAAQRETPRWGVSTGGMSNVISSNADMRPAEVRVHCKLDEAGTALKRAAMSQMQLSARAFHRVLKLARTIADLAGSEGIGAAHLAEAVQYRPRRV